MSEMKLIMENWRKFSDEDREYDQMVNYVLSNYRGILTEGELETIKDKIADVAKRYGKKLAIFGLAATILLNPMLAPLANAATPDVDLPVAAQEMDKEDAKKISVSEIGQELKDIFGKDGKLSKDLSKLLNPKKAKAAEAEAEAEAEATTGPAPEGFQENADAWNKYEFRVTADRGRMDLFARANAQAGLVDTLSDKGVPGFETTTVDGAVVSDLTVNGLAVEYDSKNKQFVAKWSPERAKRAMDMMQKMDAMKQQMRD